MRPGSHSRPRPESWALDTPAALIRGFGNGRTCRLQSGRDSAAGFEKALSGVVRLEVQESGWSSHGRTAARPRW